MPLKELRNSSLAVTTKSIPKFQLGEFVMITNATTPFLLKLRGRAWIPVFLQGKGQEREKTNTSMLVHKQERKCKLLKESLSIMTTA